MNETAYEVWLLDVSGSMHGNPIEQLRKFFRALWPANPHARLLAYATQVTPVRDPAMLDSIIPGGATNLHLALDHAASLMAGKVVIFTDGEPSDQEACFEAARRIPGVVHAIYCGDGGEREGIRFCERLSRLNGGSFVARDIMRGETLLCDEVRSLLALPAPIAMGGPS